MNIFENKRASELTEEDLNKIFTADVDDLVESVYPSYEGQHKLFEFFGYRTGGICDMWTYTKDWKTLPTELKWKYVALCSLYWYQQYKTWLQQEEEKNNELRIELARAQGHNI